MDETHLKILQMIQDGVISAEEGEKLLNALDGAARLAPEGQPGAVGVAEQPGGEGAKMSPAGPPGWSRRVWIYPLAGGVSLLALAGMASVLLAQREHWGWLVCTLPLMGFGALVAALAWWSRTARWLHVRVRDEGTRINFSLPLPLRPAAWLARLARPWVPQLRDTALDDLILSLAEMDDEDILAVEVNEGESEEVRVYFG